MISFRNAYRYYKFVPQRDGIYMGSTSSAHCIPWVEDKSAGESTSYKIYKKLEGSRWELKANEPVYFQVYGGDKDDPSNDMATITLSEVPQLESISTTQSEVTLLEDITKLTIVKQIRAFCALSIRIRKLRILTYNLVMQGPAILMEIQ